MRVLFIHNKYQHQGGEDTVFENEILLLQKYKYTVDKLVFNNNQIKNSFDKLKIGLIGFYNPLSANALKKKIKIFQPNIIHIHNFFPIASPSIFFVAKKFQIPVVMTLHNYRLICPNALLFRDGNVCEKCLNKRFPYPGIIHKCYRNSFLQTLSLALIINIHRYLKTWHTKIDKFITLTNFQKNKFLESSLNIPEEKFTVKPNFAEDYGEGVIQNRKNYFLYIGRLSQEKGILTMLKAFKGTKFKLKIVGNGPLKKEVVSYVKESQNIEYLGFKPKSEIIKLLKESLALIFPSECYEGFPIVLVEALSTGTPVITSNIGSQAEIIKDNFTGLHFKVGNYLDLKKKIFKFYKLTQYDKKLYINTRKEYLLKYTPEKNLQKLIEIYTEVLNASQKKSNKH